MRPSDQRVGHSGDQLLPPHPIPDPASTQPKGEGDGIPKQTWVGGNLADCSCPSMECAEKVLSEIVPRHTREEKRSCWLPATSTYGPLDSTTLKMLICPANMRKSQHQIAQANAEDHDHGHLPQQPTTDPEPPNLRRMISRRPPSCPNLQHTK